MDFHIPFLLSTFLKESSKELCDLGLQNILTPPIFLKLEYWVLFVLIIPFKWVFIDVFYVFFVIFLVTYNVIIE